MQMRHCEYASSPYKFVPNSSNTIARMKYIEAQFLVFRALKMKAGSIHDVDI
jgi:hypothetical protein